METQACEWKRTRQMVKKERDRNSAGVVLEIVPPPSMCSRSAPGHQRVLKPTHDAPCANRIVVFGRIMRGAVVPGSAKPFNFQRAFRLTNKTVRLTCVCVYCRSHDSECDVLFCSPRRWASVTTTPWRWSWRQEEERLRCPKAQRPPTDKLRRQVCGVLLTQRVEIFHFSLQST